MRETLWLLRRSFLNTFRNPRKWMIYVLIPLAASLLSMSLYSSSGETVRIGVVNQDGSGRIARDTVNFLRGLQQVKVTENTSADAAKKDLAAARLDAVLVLKSGFSADVRAGEPQGIELMSVKGAEATLFVKSMLESYLASAASIGRSVQGDDAAFEAVYGDYSSQSYRLEAAKLKDKSHYKDITNQALGFIIMLMMFSAVSMSELLLKEKEERTFLRLMASPVSSRNYVLANILVSISVLLVQATATLLFLKGVLKIDSGVPFFQMLAVLMLFALSAIGLSLAIVSFSKNRNVSGALQNIIVTPTCLLAGCFFPIEVMPDTIRRIGSFVPQRWLLTTIEQLQKGHSLGSLWLNLAILLAFAAVFSLIAVYRFGRNNDTRMFV
ncbi:ABC transporter permease [Paenibacillus spiritus]|uniref:ABC transporter permease n=1 Tax=Paenibacillus spiritus TaxID=2496557 RepID=A0A5J5GLT8_9BACL|nr:ABC transporter permease [Paenibacillus spiritus]KAA9008452.1 ABC transporter permease [Paenibacillus spiritus]